MVSFFLFAPSRLFAASLSILPNPSNISTGGTTVMKVYVNTEGKSINNAEAVIQFPVDTLQVVSISKSSSIFSLWVEEPSFSNITGKINFNGGIPTPGYIGSNGYIASITFKAKTAGVAPIIFLSGAVRENDGLGTDILTSKKGSMINVSAPKPKDTVKKVEPKETVEKKEVVVEAFKPSIRFFSNQGIVKLGDNTTIPNTDYYSISVDDNLGLKIETDQLLDGEYYLPILEEGVHTVNIISFEKNGKYKESVLTFMSPPVIPPTLSLQAYVIPKGDSAIIEGKTDYPRTTVNVILELEGEEIGRYTQQTRADGSFTVNTDPIKKSGLVNIWSENIVSENVKSHPSERIYLKVNEPKVVRVTLSLIYPVVFVMVTLIAFALLVLILVLIWRKIFRLKETSKNRI
ncbi:MAG TPA: cohesin domain-containing protein [Candidatus Paceibacterota bacterium]|nr:cohesin domain-containing protein [Candidatus Paceibacterota bacterium]